MIESIDVRPLLPSVSAPTLVLHRRDDRVVPVARARETAALLPRRPAGRARRATTTSPTSATSTHGSTTSSGSSPARCRPARAARRGARGPHHDDGRVPCQRRRRAGAGERLGLPPGPARVQAARRRRRPARAPRRARRAAVARRARSRQAQRPALGGALEHPSGARRRARRRPRRGAARPRARRARPGATCTRRSAAGDDEASSPRYTGPVLPEDAYEDWAIGARDRISSAVISARRRLAGVAGADRAVGRRRRAHPGRARARRLRRACPRAARRARCCDRAGGVRRGSPSIATASAWPSWASSRATCWTVSPAPDVVAVRCASRRNWARTVSTVLVGAQGLGSETLRSLTALQARGGVHAPRLLGIRSIARVSSGRRRCRTGGRTGRRTRRAVRPDRRTGRAAGGRRGRWPARAGP